MFNKENRSRLILRAGLFVFLVFWALLQLWNSRFFEHFNDGISYLDMADYFCRGQWQSGFSCFWNPLYSMLIAFVFYFLKPDAFHEFIMLKVINLAIFFSMLVAFEFFLTAFIQFYDNQVKADNDLYRIGHNSWVLLGHNIFAYAFLCLNNIATDTPDMLSTTFMFIAFTGVMKICSGKNSIKYYFIFGLFSGLAYIAKSAALPCLLVSMACLWLQSVTGSIVLKPLTISIFILGLTILPYFVYLSVRAGEPIISPAAKLNYIWFVQDRTGSAYQSNNEGVRNTLLHPVRQIYDKPAVFEFAQPVKGTYPPWFDPYYWYAGHKIYFCPGWLLVTGLCSFIYYGRILFVPAILIAIMSCLFYKKSIVSKSSLISNAILLTPALTGFLQYAFIINLSAVYPDFVNRYFGFYIVLFVLGVFASLRIQSSKQGLTSFGLIMALTGLCLSISLGQNFLQDFKTVFQKRYFAHYLIASELQKLGLHEGDQVAKLGIEEPLVDWARLARLRITADISQNQEFWSMPMKTREEIFLILKKYGIKAIVYYSAPITKQSKDLRLFLHLSFFERIKWPWINNKLSDYNTIIPPANEGWYKLNNPSCWFHKI